VNKPLTDLRSFAAIERLLMGTTVASRIWIANYNVSTVRARKLDIGIMTIDRATCARAEGFGDLAAGANDVRLDFGEFRHFESNGLGLNDFGS